LKTKEGYELVIINQMHKKVFEVSQTPDLYQRDESRVQKMVYKLLPGPNKMLPKVAFAGSNRVVLDEAFVKYPRIEEIREAKTFQKEFLIKEDLVYWIDFYKQVLVLYPGWKDDFSFNLKPSSEYEDVAEFYRDIQYQGYKLHFVSINESVLNQLEAEGKIYRFKLHNQDLANPNKKNKNLHTIYWENLFSPENLVSKNLKLNGEAEVFLRPKTDTIRKIQKTDSSGNLIFKGKNSQAPVIENERFTINKIQFHVPITINFANQNITKFNDFVSESIPKEKMWYLGIDRGENHLLYYCLIDENGNIQKQGSLNKLGPNQQDYIKLLQDKQDQRKNAKETWSVIQNIKQLKEGYLSLAIHEICKIAFEYGAMIVLENLNYGFKKSRTIKFEKSVYQKFEVNLATKLQHLFFKNKEPNELGGVLNALQLCPPLDIAKIDKTDQWGIIRYVQAAYTSKTDPVSRWRKHIYLPDKPEKIKEYFVEGGENYIQITRNTDCYAFEYEEILDGGSKKPWKIDIYKGLIRTKWNPETRFSEKLPVDELYEIAQTLFAGSQNQNINEYVVSNESFNWAKLKYLYDQVTNIRNKIDGEDIILSPVWSEEIKGYFDSQKVDRIGINGENSKLPINGDANGAFNIARKGAGL
jgi:hypothetical protein